MVTSNEDQWTLDDWGKLVLRVSLAALMLPHGVAKIKGGVEGITGMLQGVGLPGYFAYGVYIGEVVAPILIILGFFVRTAAVIFVFNMIVAILLAHPNDIFKLGDFGQWAIELPMLYLFGAVAIALLGAGRITVTRLFGAAAPDPPADSAS